MLRIEKSEGVYGPTIQGEGVNTGINVSFIRLYGCDFRCNWCDTPFSLGPDMGGEYEELTAEEVFERVKAIKSTNVVISGGNPLIQGKQLDPLLQLLHANNYYMQIETQGSIKPTDVAMEVVDFWSLSPKLPSAGEMESENWKAVSYVMDSVGQHPNPNIDMQLKFVISDRQDYRYLKERLTELQVITNLWMPVILQPEGQQNTIGDFDYNLYSIWYKQIFHWTAEDYDYWKNIDIRVLPQMHKLIWQKERKI